MKSKGKNSKNQQLEIRRLRAKGWLFNGDHISERDLAPS